MNVLPGGMTMNMTKDTSMLTAPGRGRAVALLLLAALLSLSCASAPTARKADAVSAASGPAEAGARQVTAGEIAPLEGKKVLVVYFSQGMATKKVAEDLAALSGADVEAIVEAKPRRMDCFGYMGAGKDATFGLPSKIVPPSLDPSAYDAVAVLTPVWSWSLSPPVRAWLRLMKGKLPGRVVFATISGDTEPDKIVAAMTKESGAEPAAFAGFAERDFLDEGRSGYVAKVSRLVEGLR